MSKKKLLSLALVVIMIAILSFGTLAWFSDSDSVKNDFMIAGSDDDTADEIFSVGVWEDKNGDGQPDDEVDGDDKGLVYKDILPGDVLKKEVKIENTGYYDQYIRVTVTVSDAAAWMAALKTNGAVPVLEQIVNGLDMADTWYSVDAAKVVDDNILYTLYYRNILLGDIVNANDNVSFNADEVTLFTEVKIPASMTVAQAAAFQNNFNITVKAEAVQTENLGIDTSAGYAADKAFAKVEADHPIG